MSDVCSLSVVLALDLVTTSPLVAVPDNDAFSIDVPTHRRILKTFFRHPFLFPSTEMQQCMQIYPSDVK